MTESYHLKQSVVEALVKWLDNAHAEDEEGIFRISGSSLKVKALLSKAKNGKKFDDDAVFAFDVADALKRYLRYLTDPLFPMKMHSRLMDTKAEPTKLFEVLKDLPEVNRNCIKLLFQFLVKVSKNAQVNKMTSMNIGVCFGPSLMRGESIDFSTVDTQCEIVKEIVENYDYFFNGKLLNGAEKHIPWVRLTDKVTGRKYFYNKDTHQTRWDEPEQFIDQDEEFFEVDDDVDIDSLFTWQAIRDPTTNDLYFFNKKTNETSWEKPQELIFASGWNVILDPDSQEFYYYNEKTQESVWKVPDSFVELRELINKTEEKAEAEDAKRVEDAKASKRDGKSKKEKKDKKQSEQSKGDGAKKKSRKKNSPELCSSIDDSLLTLTLAGGSLSGIVNNGLSSLLGDDPKQSPSLSAVGASVQLDCKGKKQAPSVSSKKGSEKKSSGASRNGGDSSTRALESNGHKEERSHKRSQSQRHVKREDARDKSTPAVRYQPTGTESHETKAGIATTNCAPLGRAPTPPVASISQLNREPLSPSSSLVPLSTPPPISRARTSIDEPPASEPVWTFDRKHTPGSSVHSAQLSPLSSSPPPMLGQQRCRLSPATTSPAPSSPPPSGVHATLPLLGHGTPPPVGVPTLGGPPTTPPPVCAPTLGGPPTTPPPQRLNAPPALPTVYGGPPSTPPPLATVQAASATRGGPPLSPPPAVSKCLEADWYEMFDSVTGKTFYFDRNNNVAVWERPANFSEWKELVDPGTQKTYYFNQTTKETVWEKPAGYMSCKASGSTATPAGVGSPEEIPERPPSILFAQANIRARTKSATKTLRLCTAKRAAPPCPRATAKAMEGNSTVNASQ